MNGVMANNTAISPSRNRRSLPSLLIIGSPGCRRVGLFQAALRRHDLQPARAVSYLDLLDGEPDLANYVTPGARIRIESPGDSFEVERALLRAGAAAAEAEGIPFLGKARVGALAPDLGRILHPRQWYLGFRALLRRLAAQGDALQVSWTTHPREIELLFDKPRAQAHLGKHGVPVPESLGRIGSYEELRSRMRERGISRVFVKLAHGSSASGVVGLHDMGYAIRAVTSVELVRQGGEIALYNSLRIRHYQTERDIAAIVDALCAEGVQAERWLPKAVCPDGNFDLRVLAVAGRAQLQVMRVNRAPMTNLHLGSLRGDLAALRQRMGEASWRHMLAVAEQAARLFPSALHVGLDLMLTPDLRRVFVLEGNAFGDLLPGVMSGGLDAYGHQLAALYPENQAVEEAA